MEFLQLLRRKRAKTMHTIFLLAIKSLWNRKYSVSLTIVSIALSVTLLTGVERIRKESRTSFMNTISGTDLIVGARTGQIQLLLYSIFRIGNATNNISWKSYQDIKMRPQVKWTIPISLGDSHKGYRVMGTTADYFKFFRYGKKEDLQFATGNPFQDLYDAVLGAEVASALGYRLGEKIVISHGSGEVSFYEHRDKPFSVVGILKPTGTPVDRTIHVQLEGIEAIHLGWEDGMAGNSESIPIELTRRMNLTPSEITAFLVKLKTPIAIFSLQRWINEYNEEPLTAILPGAALQQLWDLIGIAEKSLLAVSAFVVVVGLVGMLTSLLASLNERRREMAILRSVGARPIHIFSLLTGETVVITTVGIGIGIVLLYLLMVIGRPLLVKEFGFYLPIGYLSASESVLVGLVWLAGLFVGLVPGSRIYYYSLIDGITPKN